MKATVTVEFFEYDGDYIINEPDGTIYACKPDIFEKTYDIVGED